MTESSFGSLRLHVQVYSGAALLWTCWCWRHWEPLWAAGQCDWKMTVEVNRAAKRSSMCFWSHGDKKWMLSVWWLFPNVFAPPGPCVSSSSWRSLSTAVTGQTQPPPRPEPIWPRSWRNTPRCLLTMQALMSRCLGSACWSQRLPAVLKHHPKPSNVRLTHTSTISHSGDRSGDQCPKYRGFSQGADPLDEPMRPPESLKQKFKWVSLSYVFLKLKRSSVLLWLMVAEISSGSPCWILILFCRHVMACTHETLSCYYRPPACSGHLDWYWVTIRRMGSPPPPTLPSGGDCWENRSHQFWDRRKILSLFLLALGFCLARELRFL